MSSYSGDGGFGKPLFTLKGGFLGIYFNFKSLKCHHIKGQTIENRLIITI